MPKNTNKQTEPHEIKVHLRKQEVKSASELILHILIFIKKNDKNVNSTDNFHFYSTLFYIY